MRKLTDLIILNNLYIAALAIKDRKMKQLLRRITENWFLSEPLMFAAFCTHQLTENNKLTVPFRTGDRRIEYSINVIAALTPEQTEEYLKTEMIRILLKHPYQRQPPFPNRTALTFASNITIADNESFYNIDLPGVGQWPLPPDLCFEEYYAKVFAILSQPPQDNKTNRTSHPELDSGAPNAEILKQVQNDTEDQSSDDEIELDLGAMEIAPLPLNQTLSDEEQISELWEEDIDVQCEINELIEVAAATNQWGTIGEKMQGLIKASLCINMDYHRMLSIFKTSVLSHKRTLTRMKPSRRFGFMQMGSRYDLATNLLIAVDVSGSVTDKSLSHFFSVINRLFKYGVEKLDVIQFDAELKSDTPIPLKKAKKEVTIIGRGGTSFQPAADYYCTHPEYDGLIYFTDGYAPPPTFLTKQPIDVLWVLTGKREYEQHREWIKSISRNRATYIPLGE